VQWLVLVILLRRLDSLLVLDLSVACPPVTLTECVSEISAPEEAVRLMVVLGVDTDRRLSPREGFLVDLLELVLVETMMSGALLQQ